MTPEMVEELLISGADIVKVGIGPGSVCTTRKKAGVGYPQLSAVLECADAAHGLNGHIISDGGCTCPGPLSTVYSLYSLYSSNEYDRGGSLDSRRGAFCLIIYMHIYKLLCVH